MPQSLRLIMAAAIVRQLRSPRSAKIKMSRAVRPYKCFRVLSFHRWDRVLAGLQLVFRV
jgi:hypothetical protein